MPCSPHVQRAERCDAAELCFIPDCEDGRISNELLPIKATGGDTVEDGLKESTARYLTHAHTHVYTRHVREVFDEQTVSPHARSRANRRFDSRSSS